jgi:hypothetical protein
MYVCIGFNKFNGSQITHVLNKIIVIGPGLLSHFIKINKDRFGLGPAASLVVFCCIFSFVYLKRKKKHTNHSVHVPCL